MANMRWAAADNLERVEEYCERKVQSNSVETKLKSSMANRAGETVGEKMYTLFNFPVKLQQISDFCWGWIGFDKSVNKTLINTLWCTKFKRYKSFWYMVACPRLVND